MLLFRHKNKLQGYTFIIMRLTYATLVDIINRK